MFTVRLMVVYIVVTTSTAKFSFDYLPVEDEVQNDLLVDDGSSLQEPPEMDLDEKVKVGQESYHMLRQQSQLYGICWLDAMESLHVGCRQLTDESQARLALKFANCFLDKVGSKIYPCAQSSTIKECVGGMDDRAYQAYTNFFTHTQSVCFFLASQLWQRKTQETIGKLSSTADKVSDRLTHLHELQKESIDTQMQLNAELSGSQVALRQFEHTLTQKHTIEYEMLNRLMEVREFVLTEVTKFYSVAFYLVSLIVFYLMTTPTRTSEARFWIFLVFALNFFLERLVVSSVLSDNSTIFSHLCQLSESIDDRIWLVRKFTLVLCGVVLVYFAITYKDYSLINNQLLTDLHKQTEDSKRLNFLILQRLADQRDHEGKTHQRTSSSESDEDYQSDATSGLESEVSESELRNLKEDASKRLEIPNCKPIAHDDVTSTSGDEADDTLTETRGGDWIPLPIFHQRRESFAPITTGTSPPEKPKQLAEGSPQSGRYSLRPRTSMSSPFAKFDESLSIMTFGRTKRRTKSPPEHKAPNNLNTLFSESDYTS